MSEITLYEAQAKKMQGICDEHNLTYRFLKDRYPIIFIIRPIQGMDAQISMLEAVEEAGYISPEAEMMWIFKDGALETRVTGGTFYDLKNAPHQDRIDLDEDDYILAAVFLQGRLGKALACRWHDASHQRGRSRRR